MKGIVYLRQVLIRNWRQVTATIVSVVFTLSTLSQHADAANFSLRDSGPNEVEAIPRDGLLRRPFGSPRNDKLLIPADLGTIDETYLPVRQAGVGTYVGGQSRKTIYYIQDAHDSLEAQENIARLVSHLVKENGVRTVFEEGHEGKVPTDEFFGDIEDETVKEKTAYFFLDQLRIGGAEYAHITREQDFKLIGADNLNLHEENIAWYQEAAKSKAEIDADLDTLLKQVKNLAKRYFSREAKKWLKDKDRFEAGKLDLLDYLKRCLDATTQHRHPEAHQKDGASVSEESPLMSLRSPSTQTNGLKQSPEIASTRFGLLSRNDNISDYPLISLILLAERTKDKTLNAQLNTIDSRALFSEIERLEESILEQFLTTERDQEIYKHLKALKLLKRLGEMEVTQQEFQSAKKAVENLDTRKLAEFIVSHTKKALMLPRSWEANIQNALNFYETAKRRDDAIAARLKVFSEQDEETSAVLVFGGFHASNIMEILRRNGFSYYVISPKITKLEKRHQDYYKQLMTVGHHAYEIPPTLHTALTARRQWNIPSGKELVDQVRAEVHANLHLDDLLLSRAVKRGIQERPRPRAEVRGVNGPWISRRDTLSFKLAVFGYYAGRYFFSHQEIDEIEVRYLDHGSQPIFTLPVETALAGVSEDWVDVVSKINEIDQNAGYNSPDDLFAIDFDKNVVLVERHRKTPLDAREFVARLKLEPKTSQTLIIIHPDVSAAESFQAEVEGLGLGVDFVLKQNRRDALDYFTQDVSGSGVVFVVFQSWEIGPFEDAHPGAEVINEVRRRGYDVPILIVSDVSIRSGFVSENARNYAVIVKSDQVNPVDVIRLLFRSEVHQTNVQDLGEQAPRASAFQALSDYLRAVTRHAKNVLEHWSEGKGAPPVPGDPRGEVRAFRSEDTRGRIHYLRNIARRLDDQTVVLPDTVRLLLTGFAAALEGQEPFQVKHHEFETLQRFPVARIPQGDAEPIKHFLAALGAASAGVIGQELETIINSRHVISESMLMESPVVAARTLSEVALAHVFDALGERQYEILEDARERLYDRYPEIEDLIPEGMTDRIEEEQHPLFFWAWALFAGQYPGEETPQVRELLVRASSEDTIINRGLYFFYRSLAPPTAVYFQKLCTAFQEAYLVELAQDDSAPIYSEVLSQVIPRANPNLNSIAPQLSREITDIDPWDIREQDVPIVLEHLRKLSGNSSWLKDLNQYLDDKSDLSAEIPLKYILPHLILETTPSEIQLSHAELRAGLSLSGLRQAVVRRRQAVLTQAVIYERVRLNPDDVVNVLFDRPAKGGSRSRVFNSYVALLNLFGFKWLTDFGSISLADYMNLIEDYNQVAAQDPKTPTILDRVRSGFLDYLDEHNFDLPAEKQILEMRSRLVARAEVRNDAPNFTPFVMLEEISQAGGGWNFSRYLAWQFLARIQEGAETVSVGNLHTDFTSDANLIQFEVNEDLIRNHLDRFARLNLIKKQDEYYKLPEFENADHFLALATGNVHFIRNDLEAGIRHSESSVRNRVAIYSRFLKPWSYMFQEASEPILNVIRLMDNTQRTTILKALTHNTIDRSLFPLYDAILLTFQKEHPRDYPTVVVPAIAGRAIYVVSPEIENPLAFDFKGLIGVEDKTAIVSVRPYYAKRLDASGGQIDVSYELETATAGSGFARQDEELKPLVVAELKIHVGDRTARVKVFKEKRADGVESYLIQDENGFFTGLFDQYGDGSERPTRAEFAAFFSRAASRLLRFLEEDRRGDQDDIYFKPPIIIAQDGRLGLLPGFVRDDDIFRRAFVSMIHSPQRTAFMKNGQEVLDHIGVPGERRWPFQRLHPHEVDFDSAGRRRAHLSVSSGGVLQHNYQEFFDPEGSPLIALRPQEDPRAAAPVFHRIFRESFDRPREATRPTIGEMSTVKGSAKQELKVTFLNELDSEKKVVATAGLLTPPYAGRERALTDSNIESLVWGHQDDGRPPVDVVFFVRVPGNKDENQMYQTLVALRDRLASASAPGKLIIRTEWSKDDLDLLAAATDIWVEDYSPSIYGEVNDSEPRHVRVDAAANGAILFTSHWMQDQAIAGLPYGAHKGKFGNVIVPTSSDPSAYLKAFNLALAGVDSVAGKDRLASHQVVAVRLASGNRRLRFAGALLHEMNLRISEQERNPAIEYFSYHLNSGTGAAITQQGIATIGIELPVENFSLSDWDVHAWVGFPGGIWRVVPLSRGKVVSKRFAMRQGNTQIVPFNGKFNLEYEGLWLHMRFFAVPHGTEVEEVPKSAWEQRAIWPSGDHHIPILDTHVYDPFQDRNDFEALLASPTSTTEIYLLGNRFLVDRPQELVAALNSLNEIEGQEVKVRALTHEEAPELIWLRMGHRVAVLNPQAGEADLTKALARFGIAYENTWPSVFEALSEITTEGFQIEMIQNDYDGENDQGGQAFILVENEATERKAILPMRDVGEEIEWQIRLIGLRSGFFYVFPEEIKKVDTTQRDIGIGTVVDVERGVSDGIAITKVFLPEQNNLSPDGKAFDFVCLGGNACTVFAFEAAYSGFRVAQINSNSAGAAYLDVHLPNNPFVNNPRETLGHSTNLQARMAHGTPGYEAHYDTYRMRGKAARRALEAVHGVHFPNAPPETVPKNVLFQHARHLALALHDTLRSTYLESVAITQVLQKKDDTFQVTTSSGHTLLARQIVAAEHIEGAPVVFSGRQAVFHNLSAVDDEVIFPQVKNPATKVLPNDSDAVHIFSDTEFTDGTSSALLEQFHQVGKDRAEVRKDKKWSVADTRKSLVAQHQYNQAALQKFINGDVDIGEKGAYTHVGVLERLKLVRVWRGEGTGRPMMIQALKPETAVKSTHLSREAKRNFDFVLGEYGASSDFSFVSEQLARIRKNEAILRLPSEKSLGYSERRKILADKYRGKLKAPDLAIIYRLLCWHFDDEFVKVDAFNEVIGRNSTQARQLREKLSDLERLELVTLKQGDSSKTSSLWVKALPLELKKRIVVDAILQAASLKGYKGDLDNEIFRARNGYLGVRDFSNGPELEIILPRNPNIKLTLPALIAAIDEIEAKKFQAGERFPKIKADEVAEQLGVTKNHLLRWSEYVDLRALGINGLGTGFKKTESGRYSVKSKRTFLGWINRELALLRGDPKGLLDGWPIDWRYMAMQVGMSTDQLRNLAKAPGMEIDLSDEAFALFVHGRYSEKDEANWRRYLQNKRHLAHPSQALVDFVMGKGGANRVEAPIISNANSNHYDWLRKLKSDWQASIPERRRASRHAYMKREAAKAVNDFRKEIEQPTEKWQLARNRLEMMQPGHQLLEQHYNRSPGAKTRRIQKEKKRDKPPLPMFVAGFTPEPVDATQEAPFFANEAVALGSAIWRHWGNLAKVERDSQYVRSYDGAGVASIDEAFIHARIQVLSKAQEHGTVSIFRLRGVGRGDMNLEDLLAYQFERREQWRDHWPDRPSVSGDQKLVNRLRVYEPGPQALSVSRGHVVPLFRKFLSTLQSTVATNVLEEPALRDNGTFDSNRNPTVARFRDWLKSDEPLPKDDVHLLLLLSRFRIPRHNHVIIEPDPAFLGRRSMDLANFVTELGNPIDMRVAKDWFKSGFAHPEYAPNIDVSRMEVRQVTTTTSGHPIVVPALKKGNRLKVPNPQRMKSRLSYEDGLALLSALLDVSELGRGKSGDLTIFGSERSTSLKAVHQPNQTKDRGQIFSNDKPMRPLSEDDFFVIEPDGEIVWVQTPDFDEAWSELPYISIDKFFISSVELDAEVRNEARSEVRSDVSDHLKSYIAKNHLSFQESGEWPGVFDVYYDGDRGRKEAHRAVKLLHQFEIVPAAVNRHHPRYSFAHVSVNIEKQKDIYEVLKRAEVRRTSQLGALLRRDQGKSRPEVRLVELNGQYFDDYGEMIGYLEMEFGINREVLTTTISRPSEIHAELTPDTHLPRILLVVPRSPGLQDMPPNFYDLESDRILPVDYPVGTVRPQGYQVSRFYEDPDSKLLCALVVDTANNLHIYGFEQNRINFTVAHAFKQDIRQVHFRDNEIEVEFDQASRDIVTLEFGGKVISGDEFLLTESVSAGSPSTLSGDDASSHTDSEQNAKLLELVARETPYAIPLQVAGFAEDASGNQIGLLVSYYEDAQGVIYEDDLDKSLGQYVENQTIYAYVLLYSNANALAFTQNRNHLYASSGRPATVANLIPNTVNYGRRAAKAQEPAKKLGFNDVVSELNAKAGANETVTVRMGGAIKVGGSAYNAYDIWFGGPESKDVHVGRFPADQIAPPEKDNRRGELIDLIPNERPSGTGLFTFREPESGGVQEAVLATRLDSTAEPPAADEEVEPDNDAPENEPVPIEIGGVVRGHITYLGDDPLKFLIPIGEKRHVFKDNDSLELLLMELNIPVEEVIDEGVIVRLNKTETLNAAWDNPEQVAQLIGRFITHHATRIAEAWQAEAIVPALMQVLTRETTLQEGVANFKTESHLDKYGEKQIDSIFIASQIAFDEFLKLKSGMYLVADHILGTELAALKKLAEAKDIYGKTIGADRANRILGNARALLEKIRSEVRNEARSEVRSDVSDHLKSYIAKNHLSFQESGEWPGVFDVYYDGDRGIKEAHRAVKLLHQFEIVPAAVNWHHPRYSFAHVSVNIEKQKDIYEVLKRAEVREAEISSLRSPSYQENELKQSRRLLRFARNDKKRTAAVSNSETLVIADFSEMVDPSRPDQFSEVEIAELLTNPAVSDSDVRVQIYNGEMAKNMGLYQDLRDLIGQLEARHPHLEGKIELRREALSELRDEIEMHVGPVVSIFKNLDVLDELKHLKLDGRVLAFRNDAAGTLGVAVEAADAIRKSTADLLKKALPESVNWNQESSYFTAVASHARAWLDRYDQALVVLFARAA